MKRSARTATSFALIAALAACASPAVAPPPAAGISDLTSALRPNDYGNIRWNKASLHLYKLRGPRYATLTYWAANGYSTYPISCQNGGRVSATQGKTTGNPDKYFHVKYAFRVSSTKPDTCSFTAVLANTGSPPIATLTIYLN
jgi:hypothetical protein